MAGISCAPYRQLCIEHGASLSTSEMVIASALLLRNRRTLKLASYAPDESLRSVQLYGVRPDQVEQAVRMLVSERNVHHVDLNFGCPVRKITARGGGSALPLRPMLFARLVAAAVRGAGGQVPVTVKLRVGLTSELPTHLQASVGWCGDMVDAGRIAEAEGAAALTLHARTADQLYSAPVMWHAIRDLVKTVQIPVIGNGDVYEASDAVQLMEQTGCAGVMVGRAALGRPWVFREVAEALHDNKDDHDDASITTPAAAGAAGAVLAPPVLGKVVATALRHVEAEVEWYRDYDPEERDSILRFRKFISLYLYGFKSATQLKARLMVADSLEQWRAAANDIDMYDQSEPYPASAARHPRLKGGGAPVRQRMGLPNGWLDEHRGGGGAAEACLTDEACEG
ncbi:hypothetical protein VOLCADRAFT_106923 [Volvox carteri f. nagariensis]|uniref:tRNA-dihydrouridine(47) synthase [NAD(P)(+)] n=1 Tax=Volvox carteri f. nagariensis TaxID=3068 RepID=D8UAL5_VOLCA|nr:uncharacterized protein VOLCADRAFT_106923 [Volvox carteri f. nagariensis]EFJ43344.1 hypothetical protein VOLCADRAFT_106923 [Volvox carteri f. nagariensis]|eukprot:XP_002955704.1 hypothetical protein VOLCADRAFT_106923 [Volvox carteri f. nagariensis]